MPDESSKPQFGTAEWDAYWRGRIEAAQDEPTEVIAGVVYRRIRYGEDVPDGKRLCRDCGVEHGQFHVNGCCVEQCPKCDGQVLSCPCNDAH